MTEIMPVNSLAYPMPNPMQKCSRVSQTKFALMISWLMLSLYLPALGYAAEPAILILGDSLSAAYGMPSNLGWVQLLQDRLRAQTYPYRVVNASISGETSSGGASRIKTLLSQVQPEIVVVELGANDGLRGLSMAQMQQNLSLIIKLSQQSQARVLLAGMRIPPNYGEPYTRQFAQVFPDLAREYKLALVPFFLQNVAGNPLLIQDDGLHPNAAAQALLLENIWPHLQTLLVKETKKPSAHH